MCWWVFLTWKISILALCHTKSKKYNYFILVWKWKGKGTTLKSVQINKRLFIINFRELLDKELKISLKEFDEEADQIIIPDLNPAQFEEIIR